MIKPIQAATFNSLLPGLVADIFDQNGKPVTDNVGELVIKKPWVGMTNGFWQDSQKYVET
ncbi:hypothetical protein [Bacillus piscicola]|uniref:hypothetical protein n=1 Tax=Bacillus piscicola TaxID=1632684 RepID=UPI0030846909